MKTKGNKKSSKPAPKSFLQMGEMRRNGIFVPAPSPRKDRPLGERITALQSRGSKNWLEHEPRDASGVETVAGLLEERETAQRAIRQRKIDYHLEFIKTNPTAQQVRDFIRFFRHVGLQVWVEGDWESVEEEYPRPHVDNYLDGVLEYRKTLQAARLALSESIFREKYGDNLFCEHGKTWADGCECCELIHEKGVSSELLDKLLSGEDAQDVKPAKGGNTATAHKVLSKAGFGMWAGIAKEESYSGGTSKVDSIDSAAERTKRIGGKRVTAHSQVINRDTGERSRGAAIGADSSDARFEDKSAGSQANSEESSYIGKRALRQLGLTNDPKKIEDEFRALLKAEETEQVRVTGEFLKWPDEAIEKEIRKRVRTRMKAEFPLYLEKQKALKAAAANEAATLPLPVGEVGLPKGRDKRHDKRKYPKRPRLDAPVYPAETHDGERPLTSQVPRIDSETGEASNDEDEQ